MLPPALKTPVFFILVTQLTFQVVSAWDNFLGQPCGKLHSYTCRGDRVTKLYCGSNMKWEALNSADMSTSFEDCTLKRRKYCTLKQDGAECVDGLPPMGLLRDDALKNDDSCADSRDVICDLNGKEFYLCKDGRFKLDTVRSRCGMNRQCKPLNRVPLDDPTKICDVEVEGDSTVI